MSKVPVLELDAGRVSPTIENFPSPSVVSESFAFRSETTTEERGLLSCVNTRPLTEMLLWVSSEVPPVCEDSSQLANQSARSGRRMANSLNFEVIVRRFGRWGTEPCKNGTPGRGCCRFG